MSLGTRLRRESLGISLHVQCSHNRTYQLSGRTIIYKNCVVRSLESISNLRMFFIFVTYVLCFLLSPAAVIMLLLYMLVMRSLPSTVIVQIHFVAVAPDVPGAGREDQMRGQELNDEQNNAEVVEWESPVQETSRRTRSVMVIGTVTAPYLPADDQGLDEPKYEQEDTDAECLHMPVQETQRTTG